MLLGRRLFSMKKKFETEANEIQHLNKVASISGENAEWNERRAEFYHRVGCGQEGWHTSRS